MSICQSSLPLPLSLLFPGVHFSKANKEDCQERPCSSGDRFCIVHACVLVYLHACLCSACASECAHSWSPLHQGLPARLHLPLAICLPLGPLLDGFLFPLPSLSLFHIFLPRFAPHSELIHGSKTKAMSYFVRDFEAAPRDLCSESPHRLVTAAPPPLRGSRSDNWACPWTISEGLGPRSQPSVGGQFLAVMPPRWNAPSPSPPTLCSGHRGWDFSLSVLDAPPCPPR